MASARSPALIISSTDIAGSSFMMTEAASLWAYPSTTSAAIEADPRRLGDGLRVPGRDAEGEPLRRHPRQDGERGFRPHPGHRDEHLETGQLVLVVEPEQVEGVFRNVQVGVKHRLRPDGGKAGNGDRACPHPVADPGALDHGEVRLHCGEPAAETVDHGDSILSGQSFWETICWNAPPSWEQDECAWQMAMASASATSSGLGVFLRFSSRVVISMTCCLTARP